MGDRGDAFEEGENGGGERVVVVAGDHVSGVGHVDGLGVGDGGEELVYGVGADQVRHCASDEECGGGDAACAVEELVGHLSEALLARGGVSVHDVEFGGDERRVPAPHPAAVVALAEYLSLIHI